MRNNPKPTEKVDWINDDDPTKIIAPSIAQKLAGWVKDQLPPAQRFNWLWNLLGKSQIYHNAQVQDWIVINSDTDERDYATLTAYLADAPASGDRVLIKQDQTVTVQTVIPDDTTLKFLDGSRLLCATNIATSVLQMGSNIIIEGVLNLVLSQAGTTGKAVEYNGDNVKGVIDVENASTGTLTTAHNINSGKTGNQIDGIALNSGGGTLTNILTDNSTEDSNIVIIINEATNQPIRSRGAYKFRNGLEFDLGSDADGDIVYRDAGVLKRLAKGSDDEVLTLSSGLPSWGPPSEIEINWNFAAQVGDDLNLAGIGNLALTALNGTDVAFIDFVNNDLRAYRFNGTSWAQVGNDLNIAGAGAYALAALNGTDIAYIDDSNDDLRTYRFDGTNWAQVGNDLNIAGVSNPALAALNGTDIAFIDDSNDDLRVYRFDGTDWAQVGNDLNIGTVNPALTALNGTDIAFIDGTINDLRTYRFDGTDWAQVGNDLNIACNFPAIAALNGTDISFVDTAGDALRVYRFDGTDWSQIGNDSNIAGLLNSCALAALNGTDVAFIDNDNDDLRLYRWNFALEEPYHP